MQADSVSDYYTAAVLVGISGLTDMFDGKVARKFNMITELGEFIDPLADKLTQGALVICFAIRYPLMRAVLVLFIVKEGFMGIMGLLLLSRGKKLDGANGSARYVRLSCMSCCSSFFCFRESAPQRPTASSSSAPHSCSSA